MQVPPAAIHFPEADRQIILKQIDDVLISGRLTLGDHGRQFEEQVARRVGVRHGAAVNSGTSAIEICLRILGVAGREVLVPTNTFFATPAAVLHAGGRVRFVDADRATFAVSAEALAEAIGPDTAGVVVVHIAGIVTPDMPAIRRLCEERGLFLFEDAAHALGSSLNGRAAGSFGEAAGMSFYPTKVITSGEGGIILTDRADIHAEALTYRDQGKAGFETNFHTRLGYNWRMSELHAILGLSQMARLDEFIQRRQHIAGIYDEGLESIPGIEPVRVPAGVTSNYYKYLALLDPAIQRSELKAKLRAEHGVGLSGEVYEVPCHRQPIFEACSEGHFPIAEDLCTRHVCLPIFATMTDDQAIHVLDALTAVLRSYSPQRAATNA